MGLGIGHRQKLCLAVARSLQDSISTWAPPCTQTPLWPLAVQVTLLQDHVAGADGGSHSVGLKAPDRKIANHDLIDLVKRDAGGQFGVAQLVVGRQLAGFDGEVDGPFDRAPLQRFQPRRISGRLRQRQPVVWDGR